MTQNRFSLKLALADVLPVVFFSVSIAVLGLKLCSTLFFVGATICILAGLGKVIWKLLIAVSGKDVEILGAQLRYLMPVGFIFMIIGIGLSDKAIVGEILKSAVHMPPALFFIIAIFALVGMIICAKKFDRRDIKGNRIEQGINILAQACVMVGILLL